MDYSLGEYIAYSMMDFSEGDFGIKKSLMGLGVGAALGASVLGGIQGAKALNNIAKRQSGVSHKISRFLTEAEDYENKGHNLKVESDNSDSDFLKHSLGDLAKKNFVSADLRRQYADEEFNRLNKYIQDAPKTVKSETAKGAGAGAGLGAGLAALGKVISDKKKKKVTKENN